jgi:hypothetical protein
MAPRHRPFATLTLMVLLALATAGCTAPVPTARSGKDYDRKAAHTADDVHSAVETARLALHSAADDHLLSRTLDVLVTEAEADADGAASTFSAIQPRGDHADVTRERLSDLLDEATSTLEAARIAVRRDDRRAQRRNEADLERIADELDTFIDEVG